MSILEEFAYGSLSTEARGFRQSLEYRDAARALSRSEATLFARLDEDEKLLFQKYMDNQSEVGRLTAVGNLIHGYRLGLVMTAEAFTGMDEFAMNGENWRA